jgi:predicted nucleic acid-binding protein
LSGIVIDASITLSWCFPDEQEALSIQVLDRLKRGEIAVAPAFWAVEVLNTLLVGEKRGRISAAQTQSFITDLRTLEPELDYSSIDHVMGMIQTIRGKSSLRRRATPA